MKRLEHLLLPLFCVAVAGVVLYRSGRFTKPVDWHPDIILADDSTYESVKSKNPWSFVYVTASWCGPCKRMKPRINELAPHVADTSPIIGVDYDNSPGVVNFYGLRGVPAFLILKNGKEVARDYGLLSDSEIKQWLDETITGPIKPHL